jgi:hypothetical protein
MTVTSKAPFSGAAGAERPVNRNVVGQFQHLKLLGGGKPDRHLVNELNRVAAEPL